MASGDKAFFNEMLQIFIRSSEEAITKFQTHLSLKDWKSIAEVAHKLAAPAKHMQSMALYDKLKTLETQIENLSETEIESLVHNIGNEVAQINEQLRNRINES